MRLVTDSNILFTFFWKNSYTRKLFINQDLELISPEFSLEEIKKYSEEIIRRAKISKKEFKDIRRELALMVEFIPLEEYSEYLKKASEISYDKDDVDFIALALKLKCPIWSNDKEFKKQNKIKVYSTLEVLKELNYGSINNEK